MFVTHLVVSFASQGICQTAIKKVCRRLGINKWPYKEMRLPSVKDDDSDSGDASRKTFQPSTCHL